MPSSLTRVEHVPGLFAAILFEVLFSLACLLGGGVVACVAPAEPPAAPSAGGPRSTVPLPRASITGCVESRELRDYVLALDAEREQARRTALESVGARLLIRAGERREAGAGHLDATEDIGGRRYAAVAMLATGFQPMATLAQRGTTLYRLRERPRAHPVPIEVCGVQRCPSPRAPAPRSEVRPLWIELGATESFAGPLPIAYDFWWVKVRYDAAETCAADVTPATDVRGASSAASDTP